MLSATRGPAADLYMQTDASTDAAWMCAAEKGAWAPKYEPHSNHVLLNREGRAKSGRSNQRRCGKGVSILPIPTSYAHLDSPVPQGERGPI
jgi:hypothetical protein